MGLEAFYSRGYSAMREFAAENLEVLIEGVEWRVLDSTKDASGRTKYVDVFDAKFPQVVFRVESVEGEKAGCMPVMFKLFILGVPLSATWTPIKNKADWAREIATSEEFPTLKRVLSGFLEAETALNHNVRIRTS